MSAPPQTRRDQVLETFFARSVARGERSVAWARLAASVLVALTVLATDWSRVLAGEPRPFITFTGLGLAIAVSLPELFREPRARTRGQLALSLALDALVITMAAYPTAFWPRELYPGQVHLPPVYFYGMAMVVAGLRLDRTLVWLSIGLNGVLAASLLLLDGNLNGLLEGTLPADFALMGAVFVLCGLMGLTMASRTRRLVREGVDSVLQAERARQALGVYVSEEIATQVLDMESLEPGGSERDVVVLFSDLRGFTAYSDKLAPERLVAELNAYLDVMVEVIREEGGVVDKYIGDAIMVVFGLPQPAEDDAERAVRCAWRMQRALERHNHVRAQAGLPPMRQGIGVHKGPVVAGNIGSTDRLQYTVIGATVNMASRLESATKAEGVPLLVADSVVQALSEDAVGLPRLHRHGWLSLRGAADKLEVWTVVDPPG